MSLKKSTCILGAIVMMSVSLTADAQNLVAKEIISPTTGQVNYRIPLPSNWQVSSNPNSAYFVSAPNGIKIHHAFDNNYFYGQNMGGYGQGSGRQFMKPMSAQQYFQQIAKPTLSSQGHKFLTSYALPEYVNFMEKYSAGMPNTGNRRSYQAIGSDWQTGPGEKSMVTTVLTYVEGQAGVAWTAQMTQVQAPSLQFEYAKKTVRYGVANSEIGMQNQAILNSKLLEDNRRSDEIWRKRGEIEQRGHEERMRVLNQPRRRSNSDSDILDDSHNSFRRRMGWGDDGQSSSVRGIHEETIITDRNTGRRYDGAPAGRGNYWVTADGELITSEDPNYNPNTDNSVNDYDWMQYEPE